MTFVAGSSVAVSAGSGGSAQTLTVPTIGDSAASLTKFPKWGYVQLVNTHASQTITVTGTAVANSVIVTAGLSLVFALKHEGTIVLTGSGASTTGVLTYGLVQGTQTASFSTLAATTITATTSMTAPIITASTEFRGTVLTSNAASAVAVKTSGGTQLEVAHTASAVDYWRFTGGAAGQIVLSAQGASANIQTYYTSKGSSPHSFISSGGGEQFRVAIAASAVEFLQAIGATSGGTPTLSSQGTGSNLDLGLTPKGTGLVRFGAFTADALIAATGSISIKASDGTTYKLLCVAA